jgi:hypothetical protein
MVNLGIKGVRHRSGQGATIKYRGAVDPMKRKT